MLNVITKSVICPQVEITKYPLLGYAWEQTYKYFFSKTDNATTELGFWLNHIQPFFSSSKPLNEITTKEILEFRNALEEKGTLRPQSVKHILGLIRRIFNKSRLLGISTIKSPEFVMPQVNNACVRFLVKDEADYLLDVLYQRSHLWGSISEFAIYTGLRPGEIFNLKCSNIDFKSRSFHIFDSKSYDRSVPFNKASERIAAEFHTKPTAYLFSNNGMKINEVSKIYRKTVNDAGLNEGVNDVRLKVVFRTLRHTFASWLVQHGVELERVSKLLGHSSLQMTMRYAHLAPKNFQNSISVLDNL